MMIWFSVVMASKLSNYTGGARNRVEKFKRAVQSVLDQTHKGWELVIVADNCPITMNTALAHYAGMGNITGYYVPGERRLFTGMPRNVGIDNAQHQWVLYLDTDDALQPDYLAKLAAAIEANPGAWYMVNDLVVAPSTGAYVERRAELKLGRCGTSNVIHPRDTPVRWATEGHYAHDWTLIKNLRAAHGEPVFLTEIGYRVNHIPGQYDV